MFVKFLNLSRLVSRKNKENGLTVVEVVIAAFIMAAVMVLTATTLTSATRASISNENRAKALAYAQDVMAVAKQAPYRQLFVPPPTMDVNWGGAPKCFEPSTTSTPRGTSGNLLRSGEGTGYSGLTQCQVKQATSSTKGVGSKFYIQTWVYGVPAADGTTARAKEVYVQVTWVDITSGEEPSKVLISWLRVPTVTECFVNISGTGSTNLTTLNNTIPGCNT